MPDPPSCVWHAPKFVRTLSIPYNDISICRKRVGLTAGGMETQKQKQKNGGSAVLWLLAFPRVSILNFLCIALGQESYLI